jgi:NADH-quinone oxidoreductase subunit E
MSSNKKEVEMLTAQEREEIEQALTHYPVRSSGCVEALKVVQRHRRWISDDHVKDVAELVNMSATELDAVATFYNLLFRKPVGSHVILLCNSISCWVVDQDRIRDHLQSRLGIRYGETTQDGRFTLLPIVCLGHCDHAPAMMVDEHLFGDLTPDLTDRILEGHAYTPDEMDERES